MATCPKDTISPCRRSMIPRPRKRLGLESLDFSNFRPICGSMSGLGLGCVKTSVSQGCAVPRTVANLEA